MFFTKPNTTIVWLIYVIVKMCTFVKITFYRNLKKFIKIQNFSNNESISYVIIGVMINK